MNTASDIKHLNSFLRGERAAVETYQQCIDMVEDPAIVGRLRRLQASHRHRVRLLSDRIRELGGEPEADSRLWGAFAKLVQGGASLFGKSAAISTLEEGEDHGKADYERDLQDLSPVTRSFIERVVLPEQHRTHEALSRLHDAV